MALNVSKKTSPCQFFQLSISSDILSIKKVSIQILQKWTIAFLSIPDLPNITLYHLLKDGNFIYRSAIALRLQQSTNLSPTAIAHNLINYLAKLPPISEPALNFTVELSDRGLLDFYLSDLSVSWWLQLLFQSPPLSLSCAPLSSTLNLFPLQYAHARCCSILRLAEQEGLISLDDRSWFEPDRLLVHPAELNLISELLQVADAIASPQAPDWFKLATSLSQATLELHRLCPIWDKSQPHFPQIARARLGLISLAQHFLIWLLQEQIGVLALWEL